MAQKVKPKKIFLFNLYFLCSMNIIILKDNIMYQKYLLTIDNTPQPKKPNDKKEIGKISSRTTIITGWTVYNIATYTVQPYSYTWCPSVFEGSRSNGNWRGQGIFPLDFDSGITPEEVLNRFGEFNIIPNVIYHSFSDTPQLRKFRVILILNCMLTDYDQALCLRQSLIDAFPECDKNCVDAARMYFGGINSEVLNEKTISVEELIPFLGITTISKDKNQTRKIAEKKVNLYNIYKDKRISASIDTLIDDYTSPMVSPEDSPNYKYLLSVKENEFDYEKAIERVKIFKDFNQGKSLKHMELFGLATSLSWTKGGLKRMKKTMLDFNEQGVTNYTQNNLNILPYVKLMSYHPQWLKKYSPYPEDHEYSNLISAVRERRGLIEIIEPTQKLELEEAEKMMNDSIQRVIKEKNNKITIIRSSTGIGKTELLTSINNTTLAFPTHKLINEVVDRMKVDFTVTPPLPTFFENSLNESISYLHRTGLNTEVYKKLKEVGFDSGSNLFKQKDVKLAKEYMTANNKALESKSTVLTTHIRALYNDFQHDTIIFDEDPLESVLDIKKIDIRDLFVINMGQYCQSGTKTALDNILQQTPGQIINTPHYMIDNDLLIKSILCSDVSSNLIQFFGSDYFVRDTKSNHIIHYINHRSIPEDKKVIIMSATVPIQVYKALYGDRVEVVDIGNVKNQGYIEQHTDRSFSRTSLQSVNLEDLKMEFNGKPVITYQSFSSSLNLNNMEIHYWNCEGLDILKGKDIVVLGTPHLNTVVYNLYGKIIGIDLDNIDLEMKYQKIEWNGFRFMFMAYNDRNMREIQLSLIESELVQAIGRARALRTDAKVEVYSNLPLLVSDKFVY